MRKEITATTLITVLAAPAAMAVDVTGRAGTLGLGAEVGHRLNDSLGFRAGFNTFSYDYDTTRDGIRYDLDFQLQSIVGAVDWYPTGGTFRLSAGMVNNGNEFDGRAAPAASYTIGQTVYTPAEVGTINSHVDFDSFAPMLSLGWADPPRRSAGWGWSLELGILFQGEPDATLSAEGGTLVGSPAFEDDLAQEEREFQRDMDDFDIYPVAVLGVSYTFD